MNISGTGSSWKLLPDQSYERPLGRQETAFYWVSAFSRTSDLIPCVQIQVVDGNLDEIIGQSNVVRAWTNVKMRFPLLGSRLYERDNDIFLNVSEDRLLTCQLNEISFLEGSSCLGAERLVDSMLEIEHLSNDLLARIVIARDQSRTDSFYFLLNVTHIIADGLSCVTIIKTFVNELCGITSHRPSWKERLAFSVASDQLNPAAKLNKARQRWRSAIASILASRIQARLKARILLYRRTIIMIVCLQGGHGLPQKLSEQSQCTPAKTAYRGITLPPDMSMKIMQACRNKGITFSNAYPIIAQVATARLLLKLYLQGKIDEDEWDFRKTEPMYSFDALNLRPFLELAAGEINHVSVAIGFSFYAMSFLPLGQAAELKPGMMLPEVGSLLTRDRFFYRAKLIQNQAKARVGSPLFLEIGESVMSQQRVVESARQRALLWKAGLTGISMKLSDKVMTPMEQAAGLVVCNSGSNIGNVSCGPPFTIRFFHSNAA
jgi:hypothetical protein